MTPDDKTYPWLCLKWDSDDEVAKIFKLLGCSLYLIYLPGTSTFDVLGEVENQWETMASKFYDLQPLCAATEGVAQGGLNWTGCEATDSVFPDPGPNKRALPYAMWFLSCDEKVSIQTTEDEGRGLVGRLVLSSGDVKKGEEGYDLSKAVNSIYDRPALAHAIALKWLVKHKPCATKAAILKSELLESICPAEPPSSLADSDSESEEEST